MRDNDGQNDHHEQDGSSLEFEFCKPIADESANKGLNNCNRQRKDQRIAEFLPISQFRENGAVNIQGEMLGDQTYRCIHKVLLCHNGAGNFGNERVQNDIGNSDH